MNDAPTELIAGRFRVLDVLGRGGQGAVYRAEMVGPHGFRRVVAIKRFSRAGSSIDSLVDEARLASMVVHPNVVQTLEIVEDEHELAIVMEYVGGVSLARLMAEFPAKQIPVRIAMAIVSGALRGLHAVHEAQRPDGTSLGIVHRDISPSNIMIDRHGIAKVLDFGIAKAEGRRQEETKVGRIKGKLGYLAPEQIHGNADRTTDIWAAGVVLWETVCGRRLFGGRSANRVLKRILAAPVEFPPELDADLSAVLERALDRDSMARYPTAADMADAIDAIGTASPREVATFIAALIPTETGSVSAFTVEDDEPRVAYRSSTWTRWRRSPWIWSATALVSFATALVTWTWLQPEASVHAPRAATITTRAAPEDTNTSDSSPRPTPSEPARASPSGEDEPELSEAALTPPPRKAKRRRRRRPEPSKVEPNNTEAESAERCAVPWTYVDGLKKWKRECF